MTSDPTGAALLLRSRRRVVQLAYAVDDVREATSRWLALGAGPFFVADHVPLVAASHRGVEASFDHSTALAAWNGMMLELVAVHDAAPATLRETACGGLGLHHVAWFVDDLDEEGGRLERAGWQRVLDATVASGSRFAFHWNEEARHHVEVYEPAGAVAAVYRLVMSAAVGWDGAEPVRPLAAAMRR